MSLGSSELFVSITALKRAVIVLIVRAASTVSSIVTTLLYQPTKYEPDTGILCDNPEYFYLPRPYQYGRMSWVKQFLISSVHSLIE